MNTIVYGPFYGAQRILTIYDDHILLEQVQNFRSFLTNDFFNGDKEIYYSDMVACQYKEGSSLILGYLQFEVYGSNNRNNFGSENSFTFEQNLNNKMYSVYQYVRERIKEIKTGGLIKTTVTVKEEPKSDTYDELLKLKQLKDQNVITEEEYEMLKKEILSKL